MSLREELVEHAPRDQSGSLAADRFEYQRNWALCELLRLHASGQDYVVTFDYHEDVSVLNSELNPTEFRSYQIKTKSTGNWTLKALLKRQAGADSALPSILGKLCSYLQKFSSVKLLQVVSNASYRVNLAPDDKPNLSANLVRFEDISEPLKQLLVESLKSELGLVTDPSLSSKLELKVSEISLQDHAAHTRGKLVDSLEQIFPSQKFSISAVYRAILGEITARNNNTEFLDSYESIVRKKSLSRARFTEILTECGVVKSVPQWASAENALTVEQAPFPLIRALEKEWEGVMIDRLERRGDIVYVRMRQAVRNAVESSKHHSKLLAILEEAKTSLVRQPDWPYSDIYLQTCILVQIYES